MTYKAIIAPVYTREHPNAQRLLIGNVLNNQVIVGLDTKDGELGVFFGIDGQLSEAFCKANDLIRYKDEITGELKGGFFETNRRVRAQTFRGVKSEGYWTPLNSLAFTGMDVSKLKEGDSFDTLNGIPICNKYYTPQTLAAQRSIKTNIKKLKDFPEHVETEQYRSTVIPDGSFIVITEKLHGTSGRYGNVKIPIELPLWKQLVNKFYPLFPHEEYKHLVGTRRVVLSPDNKNSYYGNEQFRYNAINGISLREDEILYLELVGYTTEGKPIMNDQDTTKLKDKLVTRMYGNKMRYSYGCGENQCKLYLYRITQNGIELSWFQLLRRAKELGLSVVPYITHFIYDNVREDLDIVVENLLDGYSLLDENHIREGIVLRIENETGVSFVKQKSFTFGVLEGYLKDNSEYVDMEEIA